MELTQARLKDVLHYNPESGVFTRISRTSTSVHIGDVAGCPDGKGYLLISINNRLYKAHRLAWLYIFGYLPPSDIDHINGVADDNRLVNLRSVTHQENGKNQKFRVTNTSGFMGVYWRKALSKWVAQITVDGKCKHLGCFKSKDAAIKARCVANKLYGFHENHGRVQG